MIASIYKFKNLALRYTFSFVLLCICTFCKGQAAEENSMVGKQFPDYILTDVQHYDTLQHSVQVNIKDLRGKWVILDFWTRNCAPCIKGFPELNELQKKFADRVKIFLIGINDMYNWQPESYFEGVKAAQRLQLPVAYDSLLWRKMQFYSVPTSVIIRPTGIIHAVIPTREISEVVLKRLFDLTNGEQKGE